MPIYEFKCNACGDCFERLVFSSDREDPMACPACGGKDVCRLVSSFSCMSGGSDGNLAKGSSPGCSSTGGFS